MTRKLLMVGALTIALAQPAMAAPGGAQVAQSAARAQQALQVINNAQTFSQFAGSSQGSQVLKGLMVAAGMSSVDPTPGSVKNAINRIKKDGAGALEGLAVLLEAYHQRFPSQQKIADIEAMAASGVASSLDQQLRAMVETTVRGNPELGRFTDTKLAARFESAANVIDNNLEAVDAADMTSVLDETEALMRAKIQGVGPDGKPFVGPQLDGMLAQSPVSITGDDITAAIVAVRNFTTEFGRLPISREGMEKCFGQKFDAELSARVVALLKSLRHTSGKAASWDGTTEALRVIIAEAVGKEAAAEPYHFPEGYGLDEVMAWVFGIMNVNESCVYHPSMRAGNSAPVAAGAGA